MNYINMLYREYQQKLSWSESVNTFYKELGRVHWENKQSKGNEEGLRKRSVFWGPNYY